MGEWRGTYVHRQGLLVNTHEFPLPLGAMWQCMSCGRGCAPSHTLPTVPSGLLTIRKSCDVYAAVLSGAYLGGGGGGAKGGTRPPLHLACPPLGVIAHMQISSFRSFSPPLFPQNPGFAPS